MGASEFAKHFDGERFFNPDAPQVRGFLDVLRWKLKNPVPTGASHAAPRTPAAHARVSFIRLIYGLRAVVSIGSISRDAIFEGYPRRSTHPLAARRIRNASPGVGKPRGLHPRARA